MEIWSSPDTELYTDIFNIQIRIFLIPVPMALALPFIFCLSALALSSAPPVFLSLCGSLSSMARRPVYTLSSRDLWQ